MSARQKIDRTGWRRGPWDAEPDELLWTDAETGYDCAAYRNWSGCWCGYVLVPKGHPLHGVGYDHPVPAPLLAAVDRVMNSPIGSRGIVSLVLASHGEPRVDLLFDVHGSLTYSGERDGQHWFGFDCSHCDDATPSSSPWSDGIYWDLEYVKRECESLARQLAALVNVAKAAA